MKRFLTFFWGALVCPLLIAEETLPAWAYAQNPPTSHVAPDDNSLRRVPHSLLSYRYSQVKSLFFAPDWHPKNHPVMPDIVAYGRKPDVFACGVCHRADGPGGPENASLAGLPKAYIVQQMADFKSGARRSSAVDRPPVTSMIALAKAATAEEIDIAADYFSALKPRNSIKVIETDIVPKTFERGWHLAKTDTGESELLGQRIVEVPDRLEDFISRDAQTTFTAYVPKGSIQQGRAIATANHGDAQCESCHGKQLVGSNIAPRLAGRSPSYIVRQLYDFKYAARKGLNSQAMRQVTENMSLDTMIAIAAYSASITVKH